MAAWEDIAKVVVEKILDNIRLPALALGFTAMALGFVLWRNSISLTPLEWALYLSSSVLFGFATSWVSKKDEARRKRKWIRIRLVDAQWDERRVLNWGLMTNSQHIRQQADAPVRQLIYDNILDMVSKKPDDEGFYELHICDAAWAFLKKQKPEYFVHPGLLTPPPAKA